MAIRNMRKRNVRGRKARGRKSQVAIQFNWIFVIIAGALILFFFLSVIYKQKGSSELKISRKVIDQIDAVFTGSEVATSTSQRIPMPKVILNFICDKNDFSEFNIDQAGVNRPLPITPVFAPDVVKGVSMTTFAKAWSVPFKVTNFLFVTSPEVRYYFIGVPSSGSIRDFYDLLPPNESTTKFMMARGEIESTESIVDKNNYKVKFVFFAPEEPLSTSLSIDLPPEQDISAVKIVFPTATSLGEVTFYDYDGTFDSVGSVKILTEAEAYGAVFAEDFTSYLCNMKKAFRRFEHVAQVYGKRVTSLRATFTGSVCIGNYNDAERLIYRTSFAGPSLEELAVECYSDLSATSPASCRFSQIQVNIRGLDAPNTGANFWVGYRGCPLIY